MKKISAARKQIVCGYDAIMSLINLVKHTDGARPELLFSLDAIRASVKSIRDLHVEIVNSCRVPDGNTIALLARRYEIAAELRLSLQVLDRFEASPGDAGVNAAMRTISGTLRAVKEAVNAFLSAAFDMPALNVEVCARDESVPVGRKLWDKM